MTNHKEKTIPTPKTPNSREKKLPIQHKKPEKKEKIITTPTPLPTPPSRQTKKQKPQQKPYRLLIVAILIISILLWTQKDSLLTQTQTDTNEKFIINQEDDTLFVGKDIKTQGTISGAKNNKAKYTHLLKSTYGELGLRSLGVKLNEFTGEVEIEGKVIDFINNIYIVQVTNIKNKTETVATATDPILYFPQPGLLIKNLDKEGFTIKNNNPESDTITIANATTQAKATIRYFACTATEAYNCKLFEDSFNKSVGVQFVDSYNNKFFKLKDTNTRFVNLDNNYGIYIETTSENLLTTIIQNIQFITNERAKNNLTSTIKNICTSPDYTIQSITTSTLSHKNNTIERTIAGVSDKYEPINCVVAINPLDLTKTTLLSIEKKQGETNTTPEPKETKNETIIQDGILKNTNNVTQIPLKPGKELLFSTKGINISFPSPNISFESTNISTTIHGLKCTTSTNIVLYSNKDALKTAPSITLYFCNNGTVDNASKIKTTTIGKTTILTEVHDESWIDFANGIQINK